MRKILLVLVVVCLIGCNKPVKAIKFQEVELTLGSNVTKSLIPGVRVLVPMEIYEITEDEDGRYALLKGLKTGRIGRIRLNEPVAFVVERRW